jgi:hypothetical protein
MFLNSIFALVTGTSTVKVTTPTVVIFALISPVAAMVHVPPGPVEVGSGPGPLVDGLVVVGEPVTVGVTGVGSDVAGPLVGFTGG